METNVVVAKKSLVKDTVGANLVEYIILVGVIALIALVGFKFFGTTVNTKVNEQGTTVNGINGGEH